MTKESPAVTAHINMMQGIINRMADNSKSCKQWCILVVSAVLTLITRDDGIQERMFFICLVPIFMFCFLDCFYLDLERQARVNMNRFVAELSNREKIEGMVYKVTIGRSQKDVKTELCRTDVIRKRIFSFIKGMILAFGSFSVFPFYIGLTMLIYLIR